MHCNWHTQLVVEPAHWQPTHNPHTGTHNPLPACTQVLVVKANEETVACGLVFVYTCWRGCQQLQTGAKDRVLVGWLESSDVAVLVDSTWH